MVLERGRVVVYTAIFSGRDTLKPPRDYPSHDWGPVRHVCFTDQPQDVPGWEVVVPPHRDRLADPVRMARWIKTVPMYWLPDVEVSLWIDGNLKLLGDPRIMAESFLQGYDLAVFGHPHRTCAYQEAQACLSEGKGNASFITEQVGRYKAHGFPAGRGLVETGVILRRHTKAVEQFGWEWWAEIVVGSTRDQISFPYVCWHLDVEYNIVPGFIHQSPAIEYGGHRKS